MGLRWIPSSVPLFVLLLALAGQLKEQLAVLALGAMVVVVLWSLGLGAVLVWHLVRKSDAAAVLFGLGVAAAAMAAGLALVLEAPLWVRWRAAPALGAIEQARAQSGQYPRVGSFDGDFPRPLRAALESGGHCLYKPRGASYHVSCLGVPFTKCGYDGATRTWSGWE